MFHKQLIYMDLWEVEASTGIEPVYTDLQSAASPLRQLASRGVRPLFYLAEPRVAVPV